MRKSLDIILDIMIQRFIIAMMVIGATLSFSSCSVDDDVNNDLYNGRPLVIWSELVSEGGNGWLKEFPEVPGKFVVGTITGDGTTKIALIAPDQDRAFSEEYASKVASTAGFKKVIGDWYKKGNLSVTISFMETEGEKICTFQFVKNTDRMLD